MAKKTTTGGGTIQVRQFNGGMVTDPRDPTPNRCLFCTNFDAFTNPFKLTPYLSTTSGDSSSSTDKIRNYCIALGASSTYRLFGLGVGVGGVVGAVFYKNLTTGSGTDLGDAGWGTTANNASAVAVNYNLFVYYATDALIYGAKGGVDIWAYDPTGSTGWADTSHALSYTNVSQGLVHSMNDILFIGYDNKITQKNGSNGWTDAVLTLPPDLFITDLAEYGNYLAILAAPLSGIGNSKVFLWDMSATTWNLEFDNGEGTGKVIHTVSGALITISIVYDDARSFSRIQFREYSTRGMVPFLTLQGASGDSLGSGTSTTSQCLKQLADNRLLFQMAFTVDGVSQAGVWSLSLQGKMFAVVQEQTVNNDTVLAAGDIQQGFIKVLGFTFQSYTSSNTWEVSKTEASTYTATSIYKTAINPEMPPADKIQTKQLIAVGAMYEKFPSGGNIVVQYKVDGGSWTTVYTETSTGIVFTEPVTSTSGTTTQFTDGKEYSFQVQSKGGVEITGLIYKYTIIPTTI